VQAIGQLDDDHAHVVNHGQEHLAQVLGLLFVEVDQVHLALALDAAQLGDAVYQPRHGVTKLFAELIVGDGRVLEHVMQHASDHRGGIHAQVHQDGGHLKRVHDEGLPRDTPLIAVGRDGKIDGMVDLIEGVRVERLNPP